MKYIVLFMMLLIYSLNILAQNNTQKQYTYRINDTTVFKLPEVMIRGELPIVKVEKGRLTYNVPQLIKGKPVTNAFETLKELPGILEQNEILSLVGANSVSILINGEPTTLTYEQLINTLKSIPASKVSKVEVMYSAPPQYNIRGAMINVILQKSTSSENNLEGEVAAGYKQRYYGSTGGRVDLFYSSPRFTADVMYSNDWNQRHVGEDMLANPSFQNYKYGIIQYNRGKSNIDTHNVRADMGYNFTNKDRIDLTYSGSFDQGTTNRNSDTYFNQQSMVQTNNKVDGSSYLHNVRLEYDSHWKLKAGADYTYYTDNPRQTLQNDSTDNIATTHSLSGQKINKGLFFANQTLDLSKGWEINFGTTIALSTNASYANTYLNDVIDTASTFNDVQKEFVSNAFAGFTKSFSERMSLQASLSAEYYKATEKSVDKTTTLWDNVALFPSIDFSYVFNATHILQFSLSSDKQYPPYWYLNPTIYHLNVYSEIDGNPKLKPSREYDVSINYIFRKKYVLVAYANYMPDFIIQQSYQTPDQLRNIFKYVNLDYNRTIGLSCIIPFKIENVLNSKLTLDGMDWAEKCADFYDISFERHILFGTVELENNINLSSKPNIKLNLSGYYTTNAISGINDLGTTYDVSTGITWDFANENAKLILKGTDLFNSNSPSMSTNYRNQKSNLKIIPDHRIISLTFIYRFGGFKKEEISPIDKARFKNNM